MSEIPVITIDGPSGSGKGTIAQAVATELGFHLLDSGALYRLTGYAATQKGVSLDDAGAVAKLAESLNINFVAGEEGVVPLFEGQDVSAEIRTEECGAAASQVAALQLVRAALLTRQRQFRQAPGLVADGRDMGTVIFPSAELKIFLTASAQERAQRRYKQLKDKGLGVTLRRLSLEIAARDERDAKRAVAPLKPATDAVEIDSTGMSVAEVQTQVLRLARQALRYLPGKQ